MGKTATCVAEVEVVLVTLHLQYLRMRKRKMPMAMMAKSLPLQMSPLLTEGRRDVEDGQYLGLHQLEQQAMLILVVRKMMM